MTNYFVLEILVREDKKIETEKWLEEHGIPMRDKKQFRVTDLEKFQNGSQKTF